MLSDIKIASIQLSRNVNDFRGGGQIHGHAFIVNSQEGYQLTYRSQLDRILGQRWSKEKPEPTNIIQKGNPEPAHDPTEFPTLKGDERFLRAWIQRLDPNPAGLHKVLRECLKCRPIITRVDKC